jgi:hypothetical protein
MLDYGVGALLIASPWIFGFAEMGAETWIPVIIGIMTLIMSIFTNYELGLIKMIPLPVHLLIDIVAGILLAASPWLLGFADHIFWPHLIFGMLEIGAALLTERYPSGEVVKART